MFEWWGDLNPWFRYGVAVVILGLSTAMALGGTV
jgi:hypothetical protein